MGAHSNRLSTAHTFVSCWVWGDGPRRLRCAPMVILLAWKHCWRLEIQGPMRIAVVFGLAV